ncbi:MAG: response regulator [Bacteroidetes bacterium]|nr:response regulator [Bacteroidota bacterium]
MNLDKYRVLIADDEQLTRIGIQYFISMMDDFEVVAEAVNGFDVLEKVYKFNPDIIVLDIKMPLCSGLEVMEELHDLTNPPKVILLSGFNDFQYAQKALKFGACDYLLKPTSYEKLDETFLRVKQIIKNERVLLDNLHASEKYSSKTLSFFLPQFYLKIIKQELQKKDYNEKVKLFDIPFKDALIVLIGPINAIRSHPDSNGTISDIMITKYNRIVNDFISEKVMKFSKSIIVEKDIFSILLFPDECADFKTKEFIHELKSFFYKSLQMSVTIAIGKKINLYAISESYKDSQKKLKQRFFLGDNIIIWEVDEKPAIDKINCSDFEKSIFTAVKNQDLESVEKILTNYFVKLSKFRIQKEEWLRFCYEITLSISNFVGNYSLNSETGSFVAEIGMITNLSSVQAVKDWISILLQDAIKHFQRSVSEQPLIIRKTMKYIEKHYNKHISLAELADCASLSLNYFSNIFKQSTGKTVLEYITCRRMLEAKRLLKNTLLNISEISYELGYVNPRYFSEVFARCENMTPSQYRKTL